ncbi:hypothetical protein [Nostoc sp.]
MSKENITFRIDSDRKAALDAIAAGMNRDRNSWVVCSIHKLKSAL